MQNKRFLGILAVVAVILLIPFIAMQFTSEVTWSVSDFVAAGILLVGAGVAIELALRFVTKTSHRVAACVAILAILAVIWIELAVGLFGTPLAGS